MEFTEQQQKALDLKRHIIVTAGAGSGKTTVLVERYVRILLEKGDPPSRILAITFTEKAATEMKNRVVARLQQEVARNTPYSRRAFEWLAATPEMRISTIHAFCHGILRQFASAHGLDPEFELADELQLQSLRQEVLDRFFNQPQLPFPDPIHSRVVLAIHYFTIQNLPQLLDTVYKRRLQLMPFLIDLTQHSPSTLIKKWDAIKANAIHAFVNALLKLPLIQFLKSASVPGNDSKSRQQVRAIIDVLKNHSQIDASTFFDLFSQWFTRTATLQKRIKSVLETLPGMAPEWIADLEGFLQLWAIHFPLQFDDTNKAALDKLATVQIGIAHLLKTLLDQIASEKERLQILDFDDLLINTHKLLQENPTIRQTLQEQYRWILIDEFQDTDPIQGKIVHLLHQPVAPHIPPPNLFLVGDPQQSIYGFRNADVRIFSQFQTHIEQQNHTPAPFQSISGEPLQATPMEKRGRIHLPHNFRSQPELVTFFNRIFEPIFQRQIPHDVAFAPLEAGLPTTKTPRLHVHHYQHPPEGEPQPAFLFQAILPRLIHEIVTQDGYQFQDIALLLQTRRVLPQLEEALQQANIPYEVYKGVGFYQKQEILDLYHLLRAVENPHNDTALIAALRTPYSGISDVLLFVLGHLQAPTWWERIQLILQAAKHQQWQTLPLPKWLPPETVRKVCTAEHLGALQYFQQTIQELATSSDPHAISFMLNQLLNRFGLLTVLRQTFRGAQKQANIEKLIQFTYNFQRKSGATLSSYLRTLEQFIRNADNEGEATALLEGGNRVQILTVHAAKGLEFPVVILPYLTQQINTRESIYFTDESILFATDTNDNVFFITRWFKAQHRARLLAEHKRLFYVATTRARDQLHLLSIAGSRSSNDSFFTLLWEWALNTAPDPAPSLPSWVIGSPHFNIQVETYDPQNWEPFHLPASHQHETHQQGTSLSPEGLTYWQPFPPSATENTYTATQILFFTESPEHYYDHFYLNRHQLLPPMLNLEDVDEADSEGIVWGILVHRLLENFHVRRAEDDIAQIDRVLRATPIPHRNLESYREKLIRLITLFRQTPLAHTLTSSSQAFSELTLHRLLPSGNRLQGKLDYLYQDADGQWRIVDFKTNRLRGKSLDDLMQKYHWQMAIYALLTQQIFPTQSTISVGLCFLDTMAIRWQNFSRAECNSLLQEVESIIQQIETYLHQKLNPSL